MDAMPGRPETRTNAAIAIAVVGGAVALRAWHAGWGLPDLTERAMPLQLAFAMRSLATGRIDPDPHAFNTPSLGIYLHLLVQQAVFLFGRMRGLWSDAADFRLAFDLDPTPMVLAARAVGIACDAFAVLAAWRIGRRVSRAAGLVAALLVACSPTFVATARSVHVDSIMAALALWALERMLAWHAEGGRARFVAAAALVGLAAGATYSAAVLLLPLGFLAIARERRRGVATAALGAGIAMLAFLLTTPYAVLDAHAFLRDLAFESRHAVDGRPGSAAPGFASQLAHLIRDLGWPALAALVLTPLVAWRDRRERAAVIALWLALVAFGAPIAPARVDAGRALLPVLAVAAPLVAIGLAAALARVPRRARAALAAGAVALLVAMPLAGGVAVARRGARDTEVEARRWCETHVARDQLLVTEGYGPRLVDEDRLAELRDQPAYGRASAPWRARVDRLVPRHVVALPLAVSGRLDNRVELAGLPPVTLEVTPHAGAMDAVYYEPALFAGADWFVTTSAVRGRHASDPVRHAAPCRLYHLLDHEATVAARFVPGPDATGPEIVVYRIDARARAALARHGALDPLWWTRTIPDDYRHRVTRLLAAERLWRDSLLSSPGTPPRGAARGALVASPRPLAAPEIPAGAAENAPPPGPRDDDGNAAPWVLSLRPLYQTRIASFSAGMARSLAMLGRYDDAARFAEANLLMMPEDVPSCLIASVSLARTGRWAEARATIERTLVVLDPQRVDPVLQLEFARTLAATGEPLRARDLDHRLLAALPAGDPIAAAAAADLARLP